MNSRAPIVSVAVASAPIARLKKRQQFLDVARGRKWAMPGLVLQASPRMGTGIAMPEANAKSADETQPEIDEPRPEIRAGFTVTKKVGNAVTRNRARRRLKEAARIVLPLHAKSGCDYVLVGRAGTLIRPWVKLLDDLRGALDKAHADNGKISLQSDSDRIQPSGQNKHG